MNNEKIIDIETILAHHENQITEMSDLIAALRKDNDIQKQQIRYLSDKLKQTQNDARDGTPPLSTLEQAALDKPPHY